MKLPIGERLKHLRCERGITQEKLAEALRVSCQSVSRWELGACYPDVELLPVIANYFDVTLDDLVGMDRMRSAQTRNGIFTRALVLERQGDWLAAIEVFREAIRIYPNDDGLRAELALALSRTGDSRDRDEAISLSEKVLENSDSEKLRSTVQANLCYLYSAAGLTEKAAAMGRALPHIWECREMLMPGLVPAEQRAETIERSFNIAFQVLRDVAAEREIAFSLGYKSKEDIDGDSLLRLVAR